MRRALTVAKYLLKNQVVNPFLRRFKTLLLFAVVVGVLGGLLAVALFSGQPEAEEAEPEEGPGVREFLREFGVDKWAVLDLGSAALTAGLLLVLIQGRDYVTVMEEAENCRGISMARGRRSALGDPPESSRARGTNPR